MGGANPFPPPPTDTHTFESVGRGTCPRCPPSRTPLNYSVNVNEQYLIPLYTSGYYYIIITIRLAFRNALSRMHSLIASSTSCILYVYAHVKSVDVKIPISRKFLNILTRNLDLETLTDHDQKRYYKITINFKILH